MGPGVRADPRPLSGERCSVNACGSAPLCVGRWAMDDGALFAALERAERALERVQRSLANRSPPAPQRDEELRAKVREVVEELDELIREAAA